MKKKYTTPASTVVSLQTATIIATSPGNTYGNNDGLVHFDPDEVDASEAD